MGIYKVTSFRGALSDYEDKGTPGSFKFGANLDVRKLKDSLSAGQALIDEGVVLQSVSASYSPSSSRSPSASSSPSPSLSKSPSSSPSPSPMSASSSFSPSASRSPSASTSISPSSSRSPSSSTSPSPSGSLSVFGDLIIKFVKATDGKTYGFGNSGKIYKRNTDASWIQVYDQHQQITGAEEKPSFGGKIYLVWATRTELHRKELPGHSNWDDVDAAGTIQGDTFPKTNLTDADWHTMAQVGGDVMICNGPALAMSAYDDSYTNEAVDFIPGNTAKVVIERTGRAVAGTYRVADVDRGVNGMVDAEIPLVQVGNQGDLYYADFLNSISMKRFPGGGKVNPGGMTNEISQINIFDWEVTALSYINKQSVGNMALMGVFGADSGKGGVYTFGRKWRNQPLTLNLEYQYDASEIGAVCNVNGTTLLSYRSGSTYGVKAVDASMKATGIWEGIDFKAPDKRPVQLTEWKEAEIFMAPLPAGCTVQFWYRVNKNGAFIQAKTANGLTAYEYTGGMKAVFRIGAAGEIFEPRIVITPYLNTTAEIYRLKVFFI